MCSFTKKASASGGPPVFFYVPPNNPVRSTPLNTLYGHQLVGELDSLILFLYSKLKKNIDNNQFL